MKKIIIILGLIFLLFGLVSCNNIEPENDKEFKENNNIYSETFQGSFTVDGIILEFKSIDKTGGNKLRNLIYKNFDNLVIEMASPDFINGIENYKGDELLIHIGYDIWKENSIEILNKLKDLDLKMLDIDIRDNYKNNNTKDIESLILNKQEAILFSQIKAKYKNLGLVMGRHGIGEIICSDEVAKILGIKKEECFYIQMVDGKAK